MNKVGVDTTLRIILPITFETTNTLTAEEMEACMKHLRDAFREHERQMMLGFMRRRIEAMVKAIEQANNNASKEPSE